MVKPASSLSATITLHLGGGLLLLGIALGTALTWGIGEWLDRAVRAQTRTLATQLATVSLDAVLISDYGTLERYLRDLASQPGIRYLRIQRTDGETLGEAGAPPDRRPASGVVWARAPVQMGANRSGEVLVGYDASTLRHTLRDIGLLWAAGLLIAAGALYLGLRRTLQRRLVEPVEQLATRLCDFAETGKVAREDLPRELDQVVGVFEDLCHQLDQSSRRRVQAERLARGATERLCREQRLASVGQMAAGLAHSLNTPLGNIIGYVQQARRASQDQALAARLDVIEEQARVCAALVRHLLDSVRPPEARPRPLDLLPRVEATVALMEPVLRDRGIEQIALQGRIEAQVWADPSCVEQVLFNLLTNATEAGARHIDIRLAEDAGQARLTLADDGEGIPAAIRARLFEPFVSGKPPGKGTGLGLHLCQTLLRSVGGDLSLDATGADGTRFRITWRTLAAEDQP